MPQKWTPRLLSSNYVCGWYIYDLSVTPRQEFVDVRDLVAGYAAEKFGQPCLRVDAIQLGGFD